MKSKEAYAVEKTTRQVIEHKLLTALEEGGIAAILSQQDLEDLIFVCGLWVMRDFRGARLSNLRRGMEQLLREAFPVKQITHGISCPKVAHTKGNGYLHDELDDTPYDVDGVMYCGRCHICLP
jgi:hypothetical protein